MLDLDEGARPRYVAWLEEHDSDPMVHTVGSIHTVNYRSDTCGPLTRTEVFLQGCNRDCKGCFSRETHDIDAGYAIPAGKLVEICAPTYDSEAFPHRISICGGEPFIQTEYLMSFLTLVRQAAADIGEYDPSILIYTGYTLAEIQMDPEKNKVLPLVDMLVDGCFDSDHVVMGSGLRDFIGSANQNFYLLQGGIPVEFYTAEEANVMMNSDIDSHNVQVMSEDLRKDSANDERS